MQVYLGLGSNLGDRRAELERALAAIAAEATLVRVSPAVETPALLPEGAPPEWNRPFLNLAAEVDTALTPDALLAALKSIEHAAGRDDAARWAPRPIDIDILLYGRERIASDALTIPHPGLTQRPFVLAPLAALAPDLAIPGAGVSVLDASRALPERMPLWMGILNVTPDSFSDGGRHAAPDTIRAALTGFDAAGAQIVDVGAESTRPGATPLDAESEWARLAPALDVIGDHYAGRHVRPQLSVDTYHVAVAARAIEHGADIVNDVSGLTSDSMIELAAGHPHIDFVAMHNLGVPADRDRVLPGDEDPLDALNDWLARQRYRFEAAGLNTGRVIFDPGIGFGKNPLQSLTLLRRLDELELGDFRLLVGHSRKSFMETFAGSAPRERDLVTVGASLRLAARGVDIVRVHDVGAHANAWLGWSHLAAP